MDQQVKEYHREVVKYSRDDERLIARWCGVDEVPASANKLRLMTFDKLIDLLATHNTPWAPPLAGVRVVVIDESMRWLEMSSSATLCLCGCG